MNGALIIGRYHFIGPQEILGGAKPKLQKLSHFHQNYIVVQIISIFHFPFGKNGE